MFDFLDSDWFNIALEVFFVLLIALDVKKYFQTRKKEYILNIIMTIGFAIWALYPYYNSYVGWDEKQKEEMVSTCKDTDDTKLCKCLDDKIFKKYQYNEYIVLDKNGSEYKEFLKDAKEDCLDDSWF